MPIVIRCRQAMKIADMAMRYVSAPTNSFPSSMLGAMRMRGMRRGIGGFFKMFKLSKVEKIGIGGLMTMKSRHYPNESTPPSKEKPMKIKCVVEFVFNSGDQTLDECKEYLRDCPEEALEWMNGDATFTFYSAEETS